MESFLDEKLRDSPSNSPLRRSKFNNFKLYSIQ